MCNERASGKRAHVLAAIKNADVYKTEIKEWMAAEGDN